MYLFFSLEIHSDFLAIDNDGIITVIKDNAFNFEFLQALSVQVTATDKGENAASVLLAIQVQDVNDERPTMQMVFNFNFTRTCICNCFIN